MAKSISYKSEHGGLETYFVVLFLFGYSASPLTPISSITHSVSWFRVSILPMKFQSIEQTKSHFRVNKWYKITFADVHIAPPVSLSWSPITAGPFCYQIFYKRVKSFNVHFHHHFRIFVLEFLCLLVEITRFQIKILDLKFLFHNGFLIKKPWSKICQNRF